MKTILIIISVLLNCIAQLLMKKGMEVYADMSFTEMIMNFCKLIRNGWLWGAVFAYGLSFFLWLGVLSKTPVSYAFPFLSIGYVVVTVCGHYIFHETISLSQILGLFAICVGVVLISRS